MLYELKLADDSTVQVSMAGVGLQGELWVHVHGMTLAECVAVFTNPQKSAQMTIDYDGTINDSFSGFTDLFSVSVCDDFIVVGLKRGAVNA